MKKLSAIFGEQWVRYVLLTVAFFAALEIGVRAHETSVASLQDSALIKLQIFSLRDKTEILFLGSSRSQDGVNPTLVAETLGQLDPQWKSTKGFNAAAPGSGLRRLLYGAEVTTKKPGIRLMGVEVSDPYLSDGAWTLPFGSDGGATDLEGRLQQALSTYSYTIRYRKSFRLDNAIKFPLLIWPNADDGIKWFGKVGANSIKQSDLISNEAGNEAWSSLIVAPSPSAIADSTKLLGGSDRYFSVYRQVAEMARAKGIGLFLYVPPLREASSIECDDAHLQTYKAIASDIQVPLLLNSCKDMPAEYFSDEGHLNKAGMDIWSAQLARDLIRAHLADDGVVKHAL